uniref:Angiotensin-converting enzyme n=1 Tax=Ascaris suum TaxID=6253 RepID=F1KUV8_ASCSU
MSTSQSVETGPTAEPSSQPEPTSAIEHEPKPESEPAPVSIKQPAPEPSGLPTVDDDVEQISAEDYGDNTESTKPDEVDNDAIQQLVDRFLNTGSTDEGKEAKVNKAAQALINSSAYWEMSSIQPEHSIKDPAEAKKWVDGYSAEAQKVLYQVTTAGWSYVTSVSHLTKQIFDEAEEVLAEFLKSSSKQAKQFDLSSIDDPSLRKQLQMLSVNGMNALDDTSFKEFNEIQSKINKMIAEVGICELDKPPPCLLKHADIPSILARENKAENAQHIWMAWRRAIAEDLAPSYERLMQLTNQGAVLNGFSDGGAMWRSPYDLSIEGGRAKLNMLEELNRLFEQILPFYKQLHAYVRRQLAGIYGIENVPQLTKDGPIPAHLLKSIAGDSWVALYHETKPFDSDDIRSEQILENLQRLNYTAKGMFVEAYKYFKQLGFGKLPKPLWTKSVFSRTWSKDMVCQPSVAYDMRDGNDFRIKSCAQLGDTDFKMAHKLIAQVYYEYLYREQPLPFREAANPSILAAITNAFSLLATNTDYLKSLQLLPATASEGQAAQVNGLYFQALGEFVKLPFDLVADNWRFNIFEGKTNKDTWNDDWWRLSEHYQGVKPAARRSATDFDAIAAPAIAQMHSPAMRHFIGYIMQFQILKALCRNTTSLHEGCRLQKSSVENMKKVMMLGSSINWMEAMKMLTGSDQLDAKPLLEYYEPLISWLGNANEHDQVVVGWEGAGTPFSENEVPVPRTNTSEADLHQVLSADQVAFPGGDCSNGQECLLDSTCKNGMCECNEGLYTLKIGNTHNCVPGNPADAGFGDGHGGLVIGLFPEEKMSTAEPSAEPQPNSKPEPEPKAKAAQGCALSTVLLTVIVCAVARSISGS